MTITLAYWILAVIVAAGVGVFVGALSGRPHQRRGGLVDLAPAAARGELDLDWEDPRYQPDARRPFGGV